MTSAWSWLPCPGGARFIAVRDSTAPEGPRLTLTPQAWRALLTRLKQDAANLMC
ncbi:DUF397 domain-containing protein [Actinomadura madurae]|uniref:DUF397 domain-containing protein n=1 Tax=Actinomadura madurae TaxID=1993 RepID=UPI003999CB4D